MALAPIVPITDPKMSATEWLQQDDATLAKAMGVVEETPATPVTPEEGAEAKPLIPDGVSALETPAPVEGVLPAEGSETPEEVVIPKLERPPLTEFVVMDPEGEVEIPDLKIRFKATGKDRELSLDHVVRMAQYGFSNKQREEQVEASKQFVAQVQNEATQLKAELAEFRQYYDRILQDPAFYEESRDLYARQNTPEVRAQRTEQQLQSERAQFREYQETMQVQSFVTNTLVPTTEALLAKNPLVSQTEVIGKWTELTAPLLVRGRVPASRVGEVEQLAKRDLSDWVQAQQIERASVKSRASAAQQQALGKSQAAAALAKRQVSRVLAPSGAVPAVESAKPIKFKSADEWMKTTFGNPED